MQNIILLSIAFPLIAYVAFEFYQLIFKRTKTWNQSVSELNRIMK